MRMRDEKVIRDSFAYGRFHGLVMLSQAPGRGGNL